MRSLEKGKLHIPQYRSDRLQRSIKYQEVKVLDIKKLLKPLNKS